MIYLAKLFNLCSKSLRFEDKSTLLTSPKNKTSVTGKFLNLVSISNVILFTPSNSKFLFTKNFLGIVTKNTLSVVI